MDRHGSIARKLRAVAFSTPHALGHQTLAFAARSAGKRIVSAWTNAGDQRRFQA